MTMQLAPGDTAPVIDRLSITGTPVRVPDPTGAIVHLQFRRFAGCPVCNFHLLTIGHRRQEITAAGVRCVVVFHSSREQMMPYQGRLPFDCIADPGKVLYRRYGVGTSWRALLHPRVLWSGARWVLATGRLYRRAENGILGLPADLLIDPRGQVLAAHYGRHADDHWSVDEMLALARPDLPLPAPQPQA